MRLILAFLCFLNSFGFLFSCYENMIASETDITLEYSLTTDGSGYNVTVSGHEPFKKAVTELVIPDTYQGLPVVSVSGIMSDYLVSVKIPTFVKTIQNSFRDCPNLERVILNEGLEKIEFESFNNCKKLETITIPSTVNYLGNDTFLNNNLKSIIIENNPLYTVEGNCIINTINNSVVKGGINPIIPNGISVIDTKAFYGNETIIDLTLPESINSISSDAYMNCINMKSLLIPKNCTLLEGNPFKGCSSLESIQVDIKNNKYSSLNNCNAIIENDGMVLVTGCKNTIIPNEVLIIGAGAFYECSYLKNIYLPESLTAINPYAFIGCSRLSSIVLPANVTYIGDSAFKNCSSLKSVDFKSNITTISSSLFSGCSQLSMVEIPNSVTKIERYAFSECKKLLKIVIPENVTSIGFNAFTDCNVYTEIYNLSSVKLTEAQLKIAYVHDSETLLGGSFFPSKLLCITNVYDSLSSPSKIIYINDFAFINDEDKYKLFLYLGNEEDIITPRDCNGSNYEIDEKAFANSNINSIVISDGVTKINGLAFYSCEELTSVTISSSVSEIGNLAFFGCLKLDYLYIPKNVKKVGQYIIGIHDMESTVTVHCEAKSKPSGWNKEWHLGADVEWNK